MAATDHNKDELNGPNMTDQCQVMLDVKLDLKERKQEFWQLRNWVTCSVNIQAIKCFPCYLKISFYNHDDNSTVDHHPFSVIRINIPGIKLESAASRTKTHTYGLFWKNNRKKCKMFFAFKEREDYKTHMDWLQSRIVSLEKYRKDILDNHRINRTFANQSEKVKIPSAGAASLNNGTTDEDIEKMSSDCVDGKRDLQDVLGPLPALPVNDELNGISGRWSIRRTSGFSGIYEEILDEDDRLYQKSRASITSGIYVVMATPTEAISQPIEIPPPLPPRRLLKHSNTHPDFDSNKSKRSAWNIIDNVFGRSKKSETLARIRSQQHAAGLQTSNEIMCNKQNSFSTPDLTNIVETTSCYNVIDVDLDVMDIERSNSLNSAANQYLCRSPSLNVSSNILWSHNLSSNLSTIGDFSVVNLVGANVNAERFMSDDIFDISQAGRMSIDPVEAKRLPETVPVEPLNSHCRVIEDISGYCQMAPILVGIKSDDSIDRPPQAPNKANTIAADIVVGINNRNSQHEDDGTSYLDYSLVSSDKSTSNRASCHEEYSSSGVSSDEGAIYAQSQHSSTLDSMKTALRFDIEPDDGISITCTDSPTSPMVASPTYITPLQINQNKLDEKYPSYYPNVHIYSSPIDIKSPGKHSHTEHCSGSRKMFIKKTPTKKQCMANKKQHKHRNTLHHTSLDSIGNEENSPLLTTAHKLKTKKQCFPWSSSPPAHSSRTIAVTGNSSTDLAYNTNHMDYTLKSTFDRVVLSSSDDHAAPCKTSTLPRKSTYRALKQKSFSTLPKPPTAAKHNYRKCASMDKHVLSSPTFSFEINDSDNELNSSIESNTTTNSSEAMIFNATSSKGNDVTGGLRRFATLTRLRKIDFSPLKVKLSSILQRHHSDF